MKIYFGLLREENLNKQFRYYLEILRNKLEKYSKKDTIEETKEYMKSFINTIISNPDIINDFIEREYTFLDLEKEYEEKELLQFKHIIITDEAFLKNLSTFYDLITKSIINVVWKNLPDTLTSGDTTVLKKFLSFLAKNENSLDDMFEYLKRLQDKLNVFKSITYSNEYMYEVKYDYIEYGYALKEGMNIVNSKNNSISVNINNIGIGLANANAIDTNNNTFISCFVNNNDCSSFRKNNFFGKNYDYIYNEDAEFIVKTSNKFAKYASIGIAHIPGLTNNLVKNILRDDLGNEDLENEIEPTSIEFFNHPNLYYSDIYRVLPFSLVDGLNEEGVVVSCHFLPSNEHTIGTNINSHTKIPSNFLVRYILDNYATAREAMIAIRNDLNIYSPQRGETHLLIADKTETYYITFIKNNVKIIKLDERPYITNFNIEGLQLINIDNANSIVNVNSIDEYSTGVERYNIINKEYESVNSLDTSINLLKKLNYANTYSQDTNPFWYSEYVSKKYNLSLSEIETNKIKFLPIIEKEINKFKNRSRDQANENYGTWHTKHSVVYNIDSLEMHLSNQEKFDEYKIINF